MIDLVKDFLSNQEQRAFPLRRARPGALFLLLYLAALAAGVWLVLR